MRPGDLVRVHLWDGDLPGAEVPRRWGGLSQHVHALPHRATRLDIRVLCQFRWEKNKTPLSTIGKEIRRDGRRLRPVFLFFPYFRIFTLEFWLANSKVSSFFMCEMRFIAPTGGRQSARPGLGRWRLGRPPRTAGPPSEAAHGDGQPDDPRAPLRPSRRDRVTPTWRRGENSVPPTPPQTGRSSLTRAARPRRDALRDKSSL